MHYISSDHCNAWSLVKGLLQLGVAHGNIRVVSRRSYHFCAGLVESIGTLPGALSADDTVWATEESTLAELWSRPVPPRVWPASLGALPLDDKQTFLQQASDRGEEVVPFAPYRRGQVCPLGYPAALRLRHSWRDGQRLPKGVLLSSASRGTRCIAELEQQGVEDSELFWQTFIPGPPSRTVSVSGWYGPGERDPVLLITRKLAQDREPIGTAVAVEQIDDPGKLEGRARSLLEALSFHGPFELEYLYDQATGSFHLLELNPRFWMQHGMVVELFDNAILRRALGETGMKNCGLLPNRQVSWLFTEGWLEALVRGRWNLAGLRRMLRRRGPLVEAPDWPAARRFLYGRVRDRLSRVPPGQPS